MGKVKSKGKGNQNQKGKKKVHPYRKPKLSLVFDDKARVEFLTGFHKRKLQRKATQKAKLEKQLAAEKQRIRAEAKKSVRKICSSDSILPEVENLLRMTSSNLEPTDSTTKSYTMGSKIVTVSPLDNLHIKLPEYKPTVSDSCPEEGMTSDGESRQRFGHDTGEPTRGNVKSLLKKATNRLLQSSKAYKTSQKIKQKKKRGKRHSNNASTSKIDKSSQDAKIYPGKRKKAGKQGKKAKK